MQRLSYLKASSRHFSSKSQLINGKREQGQTRIYSQSELDIYFGQNIKAYKKDDIVTIVKSAGDIPSVIRIDKYYYQIAMYLETSSETFTMDDICKMIYGFANTSFLSDCSKHLLSLLTSKISQRPKSATTVSNVLMVFVGVKSLNCTHIEVRNLLATLTSIVEIYRMKLNDICWILSCLHNMSSHYDDVRKLLAVLISKIELCSASESITSRNVVALYGLQNMSSDHSEVRDLLKVLTSKVQLHAGSYTSQSLGKALYGLQNMSSDHKEVCELLKVLIPKIDSSTNPWTSPIVGMSFYGLQSMSSQHLEVNLLLEALEMRIRSSSKEQEEEPLSMHALCNVLYGIHMKRMLPSMVQFIEKSLLHSLAIMTSYISSINGVVTTTPDDTLDPLDVICLYQSILLTCTNINPSTPAAPTSNIASKSSVVMSPLTIMNQLTESGRQSIYHLKAALHSYIEGPEMRRYVNSPSYTNKTEQVCVDLVERELRAKYPAEFKSGEAVIMRGVILYGFECDMILRWKWKIINYEIDGSSHRRYTRKTFCRLRDEYLQRVHKVTIIRQVIFGQQERPHSPT